MDRGLKKCELQWNAPDFQANTAYGVFKQHMPEQLDLAGIGGSGLIKNEIILYYMSCMVKTELIFVL